MIKVEWEVIPVMFLVGWFSCCLLRFLVTVGFLAVFFVSS